MNTKPHKNAKERELAQQLGAVILAALADPDVIEIMLNPPYVPKAKAP